MPKDWQSVHQEIIDGLDLRGEYVALGVDVVSDSPNSGGWLSCRCFGRDDKNPSAGINVAGNHPHKGRYKEFTGDGRSLSFFDAAAEFGAFDCWRAARKVFAKKAGVRLPRSAEPKRPDDQLSWRPYSAEAVSRWCHLHKPGVIEPSIRAAGGRLAWYPAKSKTTAVICLPVFGPAGIDADPTNWWMTNQGGGDIPLYQGPDTAPRMVKSMGQSGCPSGWVGRWALAHLDQAELVWKVEGVPDMLALQSAIALQRPEFVSRHLVLTNSNGTLNVLSPEHLILLKGKQVNVVHDCDEDGVKGAERWSQALAAAGAKVRCGRLPYEVVKNHGKDIRDFLTEAA